MLDKPLALGNDGAGYGLKMAIIGYLEKEGIPYRDFGTHSAESCDYPDFAKAACAAVQQGECAYALLFCGTGVGMSIVANKMRGIRACCCSDVFSADQTRRHNNANVLCLGGRVVGNGLAERLVQAFLDAPYEGGRHQRRLDMITALEG